MTGRLFDRDNGAGVAFHAIGGRLNRLVLRGSVAGLDALDLREQQDGVR